MYRDTFAESFVGGFIGLILWLNWAGNEFDWHYAPEFEIFKFIICVGGGVFIGRLFAK